MWFSFCQAVSTSLKGHSSEGHPLQVSPVTASIFGGLPCQPTPRAMPSFGCVRIGYCKCAVFFSFGSGVTSSPMGSPHSGWPAPAAVGALCGPPLPAIWATLATSTLCYLSVRQHALLVRRMRISFRQAALCWKLCTTRTLSGSMHTSVKIRLFSPLPLVAVIPSPKNCRPPSREGGTRGVSRLTRSMLREKTLAPHALYALFTLGLHVIPPRPRKKP